MSAGLVRDANGPEWLDDRLVTGDSLPEPGLLVHLAGSWCDVCGRAEFPQRTSCPQCLGETSMRALSNAGTVVGHTAVLHQPPGSLLDAPYGVVAVEHDKGVSVLGPLVGCPWDGVRVGDTVVTVSIEVGDRLGFGYRLE